MVVMDFMQVSKPLESCVQNYSVEVKKHFICFFFVFFRNNHIARLCFLSF